MAVTGFFLDLDLIESSSTTSKVSLSGDNSDMSTNSPLSIFLTNLLGTGGVPAPKTACGMFGEGVDGGVLALPLKGCSSPSGKVNSVTWLKSGLPGGLLSSGKDN